MRSFASIVAVAILSLAAACNRAAPEERYHLTGTIVAIDAASNRVTIKHDEIPGYMPAMTMPFRLKDGSMMEALEPGRSVSADLVVADKRSWLENVVIAETVGQQSLPSTIEGATDPVPGEQAPAFSLVDQSGRTVTLESLRGKAVALTFIYTRCPLPDYCPLMTDNFAAVRRQVDAVPGLGDDVVLISISIDPDYDTPEVMCGYGERFASANGAIPRNWLFATGSSAEIRKVAESYGLVYHTENDQIVHSLRTAVIAPDGRLVKVFRGNEWKPEEVVKELGSLAGEIASSHKARG